MKTEKLFNRSIFLVIGIFIMSFGVALSVKSNLGTTSISAFPYVLSLFTSFSIGTYTVVLNAFFIVLQILILRKKFHPLQLFQLPVVFFFGWFIDLSVSALSGFSVSAYWMEWLLSLLSSVVIALGVFLLVKSNMILLPGDALVMAIANKRKLEFGKVKIAFDSLLVVISVVFSLIFLRNLQGVREGTVVAAFLVGAITRFYSQKFTFVDKLIGVTDKIDITPPEEIHTQVITISREYGSGGHEVGELVAKKLGFTFYDTNLIELSALEGGFTPEFVKENEQKLKNSLLYSLYKHNYAYVNEIMPPQDALFLVQSKIIRDISEKSSCVIVGRSADFILKSHPNCFNVFVHADKAFRLERIINNYGFAPGEAEAQMERKDKERINFSKYYTHRNWGEPENYHLTVDSSTFGIEIAAALIVDAWRKTNVLGKTTLNPQS
ncbi:MAG TPA: cytidylate kinase family protein [Paludibacteraceae bacterium]|nr:cytidylate kinase family protein [Paludibacteraceae bacterium]